MTARYGKYLRDYLAKNTDPKILIDFSKAKIFKAATVFVNILLFQKQPFVPPIKGLELRNDYRGNGQSLAGYFRENHISLHNIDETSWQVATQEDFNLIKKIEARGTILKKWELNFYRGITTGLNKAFHIDEAIKSRLIREDPKSKEIIKPLLRGRDIKRYKYNYSNIYIIFTKQGIDIEKYSSAEKYLNNYFIDLKPRKKSSNKKKGRKPGNYEWFEIQDKTAYYQEFEEEKIVWLEISDRANYSFDDEGMYLTNSAYFMSGKNLKYLLAVLNSNLADYYFFQITAQIAGGRKRYTKQYVEKIPVPKIDTAAQQPFKTKVNQILKAKENGSDTRQLEQEVNRLVYELYELTAEEIALVENTVHNH